VATGTIVLKSDMQRAFKDLGLLQKDLNAIRKEINGSSNDTQKFGLKFAAGIGVALAAVQKGIGAVGSFVSYATEMDTLRTTFNTVFADGEAMFMKVQEIAENSTISTKELALSIQGLGLAFGGNIPQIEKTNAMLQDLALGNTDKYRALAREYTQAMNAGKVSYENIKSISNTGIPVMALLTKTTGKSTAELQKMASQGKLSVETLNDAFKQATEEGGQFFEGQQKQAESLAGRWESLKERAMNAFYDMWRTAQPALQNIVKALGWVMDNFNRMLPILAVGGAAIVNAIYGDKIKTAFANIYSSIAKIPVALTAANIKAALLSIVNPLTVLTAAFAGIGYLVHKHFQNQAEIARVNNLVTQSFQRNALSVKEYEKAINGMSTTALQDEHTALGKKIAEVRDRLKTGGDFDEHGNFFAFEAAQVNKLSNELNKLDAQQTKTLQAMNKKTDETPFKFTPIKESSAEKAQKEADRLTEITKTRLSKEMELLTLQNGEKVFLMEEFQAKQAEFQAVELQGIKDVETAKAQQLINEINNSKARVEAEKKVNDDIKKLWSSRVSAAGDMFANLAAIAENADKNNRGMLIAARSMMIAEGTMRAILSVINSYEQGTKVGGPALGATFAAIAGAAQAIQLAKLAATPIKAETGLTNYTVPEGYNTDSFPVAAKTGETVNITPRGEETNQEQTIIVNIDGRTLFQIINEGIRNGNVNINANNIGSRVSSW